MNRERFRLYLLRSRFHLLSPRIVILGLFFGVPIQADIYRWDNGLLIPGTEGIIPGLGVQLDHPRLEYAALEQLDLTGASFEMSNLFSAHLWSSTLTNANVRNAFLLSADLSSSTLVNANLSRAQLGRANQSSSTLTNANLSGADLDQATCLRWRNKPCHTSRQTKNVRRFHGGPSHEVNLI